MLLTTFAMVTTNREIRVYLPICVLRAALSEQALGENGEKLKIKLKKK